jgi:hypothetical protein
MILVQKIIHGSNRSFTSVFWLSILGPTNQSTTIPRKIQSPQTGGCNSRSGADSCLPTPLLPHNKQLRLCLLWTPAPMGSLISLNSRARANIVISRSLRRHLEKRARARTQKRPGLRVRGAAPPHAIGRVLVQVVPPRRRTQSRRGSRTRSRRRRRTLSARWARRGGGRGRSGCTLRRRGWAATARYLSRWPSRRTRSAGGRGRCTSPCRLRDAAGRLRAVSVDE